MYIFYIVYDKGSGSLVLVQRTSVTDIVQYVTNTKWNWAGHIARMKDNRWTFRSTAWQTGCVRSAGRPKRHWRDDIVGQQGSVWMRTAKDRERRKAVEGHGLEQNRIECDNDISV